VLRSWPAVFWDDQDRATGFWRLALAGMPPHGIRHAGTGLSAWCAWDPLFLALVIGDVQVATAGPVTGEAITSDIARDGTITRRLPPRHGAVVPARRSRSGA
jgi:alkylmercury lyase-like protein